MRKRAQEIIANDHSAMRTDIETIRFPRIYKSKSLPLYNDRFGRFDSQELFQSDDII